MALMYSPAPFLSCVPSTHRPFKPSSHCPRLPRQIRCTAQTTSRRSANYQPSSWSDDYIQSLTSNFKVEEDNARRIRVLKEDVKQLIYQTKEIEDQLQLIDHLQQLGVAYHFKEDIKDALWTIYASLEDVGISLKDNLHATALLFRLLREHGFVVSEDIFNKFKDEKGYFKFSLRHQPAGLLSLYEASCLAKEEELVLDEATDFTTKHLKGLMEGSLEPHLRQQVAHALELPLNWRMPRLQTRWFIEACQREGNMNPVVLEFSKLDFNVVQSIHQEELREVSRWWNNLGLAQSLPFSRDRLVENYFWTTGWAFEPQFRTCREVQTKANCLITTIDDVYDVYGTLEELQLFTDAVDRWDVNATDRLPEYMKICFLALFNTANDAAYSILKEKGLHILPHLKRAWADLCKAYMVEASWYYHGYKPKLEEYLENALVSVSGPLAFTLAYCTVEGVTKEALEGFRSYPGIARWSSMILRLCDDLGTSSDELQRGDVPKSIHCYMHESGVSEDVAREHIRELIRENWRAINGDRTFSSSFEENLKSVAINVPRMAQCMYQHGDGHGKPGGVIKDRITSLLIEPILL